MLAIIEGTWDLLPEVALIHLQQRNLRKDSKIVDEQVPSFLEKGKLSSVRKEPSTYVKCSSPQIKHQHFLGLQPSIEPKSYGSSCTIAKG